MGTTCIWHFKRNPFEKTRRQLQTQNQYHACKSDSASYQLVNFPIKKGLCCWEVRILLGKSTWRRNSLTGISNFASSFWRFNAVHSEDLFGSIRKGHTTKSPFKWKGGWLKTGVESDAFFTFFQPCQVASNLSNLSRKKKDLPKKKMLKKLADFFSFLLIRWIPACRAAVSWSSLYDFDGFAIFNSTRWKMKFSDLHCFWRCKIFSSWYLQILWSLRRLQQNNTFWSLFHHGTSNITRHEAEPPNTQVECKGTAMTAPEGMFVDVFLSNHLTKQDRFW